VIIVVFVVLALCGVGFYVYSRRKGEEHEEEDED
jgi:flagellar basal body-associated protein FliL